LKKLIKKQELYQKKRPSFRMSLKRRKNEWSFFREELYQEKAYGMK